MPATRLAVRGHAVLFRGRIIIVAEMRVGEASGGVLARCGIYHVAVAAGAAVKPMTGAKSFRLNYKHELG